MPPIELDIIRALQFCYYVKNVSIVPDARFDEMARSYEGSSGELAPLGSDKADSYTPAQRALALYFLLSLPVVESLL